MFNTNTSNKEEIIICFRIKEDDIIEEVYTINNKIHRKEQEDDNDMEEKGNNRNNNEVNNSTSPSWFMKIYNTIITYIFSYFSVYNTFERSIISMDYNKDNNQLLVLNNDGDIIIWNMIDGTYISSLLNGFNNNNSNMKIIQSVYWNNNIIVNYEDGLINIYDNKLEQQLSIGENEYIQTPLRIVSNEDKVFILVNKKDYDLDNNINIIELKCLSKCTPSELLSFFVENKVYENALKLCDEYRLKKDIIYKQQWLDYVSKHNNNPYRDSEVYKRMLNKIEDNIWIINQIMTVYSNDSSDNESDALQFGIKICKDVLYIDKEIEKGEERRIKSIVDVIFSKDESDINLFIYLLILLKYNQYHEIYKEYIRITKSEYDSQYFQQLLSMKMNSWISDQAKKGNYEVIILFFKKYKQMVLPYRLEILNNLSTIVSPSLYQDILPSLSLDTSNDNNNEWFNRKEIIEYVVEKLKYKDLLEIYRSQLDLFYYYVLDEGVDDLLKKQNNKAEICGWYKSKISRVYNETHLLSYCYDLSNIFYSNIKDITKKEEKNDIMMNDYIKYIYHINELYVLAYEKDTLLSTSLNDWLILSIESKIQLLLQHSTDKTIVSDIYTYIFPFMDLSLQYGIEDEYYNSLKDYIMKQSENKSFLPFVLEIFKTSKKNSVIATRIIRTDEEVKDMVIKLCLNTKESSQFNLIADILDCVSDEYANNSNIIDLKWYIDVSNYLSSIYQIYIEIPKYKEWKDKYEANKDKKDSLQLLTEINEYNLVYNMYKKKDSVESLFRDIIFIHEYVFSYVNIELFYEIVINQLLLDNNFYSVDTYKDSISRNKLIDLIIKTSKMIYTSASNCLSPELDKALECLELIEDNKYEEIEKEKSFIYALKMIPLFKVEMLPAEVVLHMDNKIRIIENIMKNNPNAYMIDNNYMPGHHLLEFANKIGINSQIELLKVKVMMLQSTMKNKDFQLSHQFCIELILSNEIRDKNMIEEREIIAEFCYDLVKENENSINFAGQIELIEFAITNGSIDVIEKAIEIYPNVILYNNISDLLKIPSVKQILPEYFQKLNNIKFELPDDICDNIWESRKILEPLLENKKVNQLLTLIYSMLLNHNKENRIDIYTTLLKIQLPKDIITTHGVINEMICNTDLLDYDEIINQYDDLNYVKYLYSLLLFSLNVYIIKTYNNEEINTKEMINSDNEEIMNHFEKIKTEIPKLIPYIELYQSICQQYQSLLTPDIFFNSVGKSNNSNSVISPSPSQSSLSPSLLASMNSERYFNHCKSSLHKSNTFSSCVEYLKFLNANQFSLFCNELFSDDVVSKEIQLEFLNYFSENGFIDLLYNHLIEDSNAFDVFVLILLYKLLLYKDYKKNELFNTYKTIILIDYFPKFIQNKNELVEKVNDCSNLFSNILDNFNIDNDVEKSKKLLNVLMIWDNLKNNNIINCIIYDNIKDFIFNPITPKDINYGEDKVIITLTSFSFLALSNPRPVVGEKEDDKEISANEKCWFIYLNKYHSVLSNQFISLQLYYYYRILSEESIVKLFNSINKSFTAYEYSYFLLSFSSEDNILMVLNHLSDYIQKNKTFLYENIMLTCIIISQIDISILIKSTILFQSVKNVIFGYMKEWLNKSRESVVFILSIPYLIMKLILCGCYVESVEVFREYSGLNIYLKDMNGIWQSLKLYLNRLLRISDPEELRLGWEFIKDLVNITIKRMDTINF